MPIFAVCAEFVFVEATLAVGEPQLFDGIAFPDSGDCFFFNAANRCFTQIILVANRDTSVAEEGHLVKQAAAGATVWRGHVHDGLVFDLTGEIVVTCDHREAALSQPTVVKVFHRIQGRAGLDHMRDNQRA